MAEVMDMIRKGKAPDAGGYVTMDDPLELRLLPDKYQNARICRRGHIYAWVVDEPKECPECRKDITAAPATP